MTGSPAVVCAATSEYWRRDVRIVSAFVTVSTAASMEDLSFTLSRSSLRRQWRSMAKRVTMVGAFSVLAAVRPSSGEPQTKSKSAWDRWMHLIN